MPPRRISRLQWPADFWAGFRREGDCLIWQGAVGTNGYGRFTYRQRRWRTHQLAYTLGHGPIPEGYDVCHTCDTRLCGEPTHLFLGVRGRDNSLDMWQKGRARPVTRYPDGLHHSAKLSFADVGEIRAALNDGISSYQLAHHYGVCQSTIMHIKRGRHWT